MVVVVVIQEGRADAEARAIAIVSVFKGSSAYFNTRNLTLMRTKTNQNSQKSIPHSDDTEKLCYGSGRWGGCKDAGGAGVESF